MSAIGETQTQPFCLLKQKPKIGMKITKVLTTEPTSNNSLLKIGQQQQNCIQYVAAAIRCTVHCNITKQQIANIANEQKKTAKQ